MRDLQRRDQARQLRRHGRRDSVLRQAFLRATNHDHEKEGSMKDFDKYMERSKQIQKESDDQGDAAGYVFPWVMIVIGVIVTGFQTHALTYRGMQGYALYADWLDIAAVLPVFLLEGTAIALIYCRLRVFKGDQQRALAHRASYAVWAVLLVNTIAVFTLSGGTVSLPIKIWTRFFLPLAIVAVPYLWKRIIDLHPDSQERIAVLDAEARYNAEWRRILADQRQQIVTAYRDATDSEEVREATRRLVQKAALKQAGVIAGAITESESELRASVQSPAPPSPTRSADSGDQMPVVTRTKSSGHVNGETSWD